MAGGLEHKTRLCIAKWAWRGLAALDTETFLVQGRW